MKNNASLLTTPHSQRQLWRRLDEQFSRKLQTEKTEVRQSNRHISNISKVLQHNNLWPSVS